MKRRMKRRKINTALVFALAAALLLPFTGCSSETKNTEYTDGTYSGRSSDFADDESGNGAGYGTVEVTVKDNKVVSCTFKMFELDGTLKDETYGADLSRENRLKAQKAVQSAPKYAAMLEKSGTLDGIDAISGATVSYNEFKEAVGDALKKAEKQ